MLFIRSFGRMGTVGRPYYAVFPWVDVLVSVLLISTVARVLVGDGGVTAGFNFLRGGQVSWNKLKRLDRNTLEGVLVVLAEPERLAA